MRRWGVRVIPAALCGTAAVVVGVSLLLSGSARALPGSTSAKAKTAAEAPGSVLRLQQLLAQLGYLPVTFTPATDVSEPTTLAAEEATRDEPLAGNFAWRWKNLPWTLRSEWSAGKGTVMVKGALMAFAAAQDFYSYEMDDDTVSQLATNRLWTDLFKAALADERDPYPYSYVYVTQTQPETLTLWENGKVALTSPANTGIAQAPTANGTFPVYLRLTYQVMKGTNPSGVKYADPVWWINYFNGSDAVHGFVRGSYGWPQSLGCVELPVPTAKEAFPMLAIGDLVTVAS
jgi:lipoprotein-anchoring transpeptidase ErfK/SrfK